MSDAVRETICTQCKHRDICKYCEDVIKAESAAREINSRQKVYSPASIKVVCTRREASYVDITNRVDDNRIFLYGGDNECKL